MKVCAHYKVVSENIIYHHLFLPSGLVSIHVQDFCCVFCFMVQWSKSRLAHDVFSGPRDMPHSVCSLSTIYCCIED